MSHPSLSSQSSSSSSSSSSTSSSFKFMVDLVLFISWSSSSPLDGL
jgi:hypothetical protein